MSIAVVGAGAFGTALAIVQAARGPVTLLARSADHAEAMRRTRENAQRLPGVPLPEAVRPTADSAALADARIVLFAVPTQSLGEVARAMPVAPDAALVACCKGIDLATGRGGSSTAQIHQALQSFILSLIPAILDPRIVISWDIIHS